MNDLEHNDKNKTSGVGSGMNETSNGFTRLKSKKDNNFYHFIELAVDGILVGTQEGYISEANSMFCSITGRKKEEVIGKHISLSGLLFTPETLEKVPLRFDLLEKGKTVVLEREILRPDGTGIMVEMRTKMMPDGTFQSIFRDITERKKQEAKLEKYAAELHKLNADKDLFLSILAHDLSNHFNTIIGFLDVLKNCVREFTVEETEEQIQIVHKSAKIAHNLLQDLLIWTKAQSGFVRFNPDDLKLFSLCNEVMKSLKYRARNKELSIKCNIPHNLIVYADGHMLKTIIRNLLANAIKFTPSSGEINIISEKNESEVLITVSDTGQGIEPDAVDELFKRYGTYSTEGTQGEKGTGLGLLICKLYVEKHQGKIWVESTPGKGSSFKFTIPIQHYQKSE